MPGKLTPEQRPDRPERENIPPPFLGGELSDEDRKTVGWRFKNLIAAGYSTRAAEIISMRFQGSDKIDLHDAIDLYVSIRKKGKVKGDEIEKEALEILL